MCNHAKSLISAEAKKSPIKDVLNYMYSYLNEMQGYFHKYYDWLCPLATFFLPQLLLRCPSNKANHTCYQLAIVYVSKDL